MHSTKTAAWCGLIMFEVVLLLLSKEVEDVVDALDEEDAAGCCADGGGEVT